MPRMEAPAAGVNVRMYRPGHGDCFLLAFRDDQQEPFYLLIDCGCKPGSAVHGKIQEIVDDIGDSTGNHLHAVLITHEHDDHVNGFWSKTGIHVNEHFDKIAVDRLWLAWTENPADDLANALRERYGDTLIGLRAAHGQMAAAAEPEMGKISTRIGDLLSLEGAVPGETNKLAIDYIRRKTKVDPQYLRPDQREPYVFPGVPGVNIYALGPPRKEEWLLSLDPIGTEGYARSVNFTPDAASFLTAAVGNSSNPKLDPVKRRLDEAQQPFSARYRIPYNPQGKNRCPDFIRQHYGVNNGPHRESWRRINYDWLRTAEMLALRLNTEVNNTCLVVAIELPTANRKVLLFAGDAQRGNWRSWSEPGWVGPDGKEVTAKELLARTVLYKVGHHGSHNGTLKGSTASKYANLGWMAQGNFRNDFVAMIPANRGWAYNKANWKHPLPSIEEALSKKAKGRVFRIDRDTIRKPREITASEWNIFRKRTKETPLYFEYEIPY